MYSPLRLLTISFSIVLLTACQQPPSSDQNGTVTILALDPLFWIHAKMIAGDIGRVTIAVDPPSALPSFQETKVILGNTSISESPISKQLQNYRGLYVTIPKRPNPTLIPPSEEISRQIAVIRDALSDADPQHRGYYHDNAGNYMHLVEETNNKLLGRINEYHRASFMTIGSDFTPFIEEFWLEWYHMKHHSDIRSFLGDRDVKNLIRGNQIRHIFVTVPLSENDMRSVEETYGVTLYRIAPLQDDTSRWGYLRFVEKIMNEFVRAFDTYD